MWVVLYVVSIVAVNWLFIALAPWSTPLGDLYLANVIVGFVFVLRDYAQREIGHYILFATALAGVLTWFMVDPAIALASIVAKVERDRLLVELEARYPQYGFATHKGYGTPEHVEALRQHGPCPEHRDLFVRSILAGEAPPPEDQGEFRFE
mgnify:CR=1 FL=1